MIDPSWTYDIQLAVDRTNGNMQLEDAGWIQKDLGEGWKLRIGQMKAPFMREELLSSIRMLAVERSLVNAQFTAGLVQGIQLSWDQEQYRVAAMFHHGNRSGNTSWSVPTSEYAGAVRVEWMPVGQWRQFLDYSGFKDEGQGILVGLAASINQEEYGTGGAGGNNNEVRDIGLTADVTFDFEGASISAAGVYRNRRTGGTGPSSGTVDQYGMFVRGGYFLTDEWELYGQYEWATLDLDGVKDLSVVTIGATRYWAKHTLKWQTDVGYSFNELAASWSSNGAGWRTDSAGEDGQIVIRSQLQIVF